MSEKRISEMLGLKYSGAVGRIDDFKGCCDNGCVIKRPKGMGTNAKCRCPDYKLRAFIHALKTVIDRQSPVVEAAKEWKAAKEDAVIWKVQRARLMLKKALSDMEGKRKP